MAGTQTSAGALIRQWRNRRHLSQLDLALDAEISQRHLSFLENGRAKPSAEMVLRLCEHMDLPLRHRNTLLVAAGFAPRYCERELSEDGMRPAIQAVEQVLKGHEPYPAIAVDRCWNIVLTNTAAALFLNGVDEPSLTASPVNALRLALHPKGLAPSILNFREWRAHLLSRLQHQIDLTSDSALEALEQELLSYPDEADDDHRKPFEPSAAIALPMQMVRDGVTLSFISTITVFGTPLDVTLSELAVESFFPADAITSEYLRTKAAGLD